jgi:hypothetical protein
LLNEKENQDRKLKRRMHRRQTLQRLAQQDDLFLEESITTAEDERTAMAKADKTEYGETPSTKPTIRAMQNRQQALPNSHETLHTEFAQHSREQPHES